MKSAMVLHIPVLHNGYLQFFEKHKKEANTVFILDEDLAGEFMPIRKEIRAISSTIMRRLVESLGFEVYVFSRKTLRIFDYGGIVKVFVAGDQVSRGFAEKYLSHLNVIFDDIFLRWDQRHVLTQKPVDYARISTNKFDLKMCNLARKESEKSSDWWRHVGAIIVKDRKIVLKGYNRHVPSEHIPYAFGDIRDHIKPGTNSHISSALHAEQTIITEAAKKGISLEGTSIYLTTFPCTVCAKLIAYSGIKKCYFTEGHASFDGEEILAANGVETILVNPVRSKETSNGVKNK